VYLKKKELFVGRKGHSEIWVDRLKFLCVID